MVGLSPVNLKMLLLIPTRASLSHGTPPHIYHSQWDVPVPDPDSLLTRTGREAVSHTQVQGSYSFVALCQLTAILSNILPLIYTLQTQPLAHAFKALRQHETALDRWEDDLPLWLNADSGSFERKAPGALNLQFCHLVVRMYLCRMGLLVGLFLHH
jgi:Fungal specific transcription factor domain